MRGRGSSGQAGKARDAKARPGGAWLGESGLAGQSRRSWVGRGKAGHGVVERRLLDGNTGGSSIPE